MTNNLTIEPDSLGVFALDSGTVTYGSPKSGSSIVDSSRKWQPGAFKNKLIKIWRGTGKGQIYSILDNDLDHIYIQGGLIDQVSAGDSYLILEVSDPKVRSLLQQNTGLVFWGTVTAVPGANQFTIASLAGLGAGRFKDVANPYWAFVLRDAGGTGAAPQGEQQQVTAYDSAAGSFTTNPFSAPVAVGDEVLILHPGVALSALKTSLDGVYVDTVEGTVGTDWPSGTPTSPVNNLADAYAIADARKLSVIYIRASQVVLTMVTPTRGLTFVGSGGGGDAIDLNGALALNSVFVGCNLIGAIADTFLNFFDCVLTTVNAPRAFGTRAFITGTQIVNNGEWVLDDCYFRNATLSFSGASAMATVSGRGILTLANLTGGVTTIQGVDGLVLTIAASCTGGTINIFGNVMVVNNSSGAIVNDYTEQTESAWKATDGVYVDSANGVALATHSWTAGASPVGLPTVPVSNLTDAYAIAAAHKLKTIYVRDQSGLAMVAPGVSYIYVGRGAQNDTIILGAVALSSSVFKNLYLSSGTISDAYLYAEDCWIVDLDIPSLFAKNSILGGTLTIHNSTWDVDGCYFRGAIISCNGVASGASIRGAKGALTITNMTGGTIDVHGEDGLLLTIAASCTAGSIYVYGDVKIINNSGGTSVYDNTEQTEAAWKASDGVYVDSGNGVALATNGWAAGASPVGLPTMPVSNTTDAYLIAAARKTTTIQIRDMSGLTLSAPPVTVSFMGRSMWKDTIDLNGVNLGSSPLKNCRISGALGDTYLNIEDVQLQGVNVPRVFGRRLFITGSQTINGNEWVIHDCFFRNATLDFNGAGAYAVISGRGFLQLTNITGSVTNIQGKDGLQVVIAASCTAGTVNVYGNARVINNSGGTIVNDYTPNFQIAKLAGATPSVGATTANWNTGIGTSGEAGADLVTIGADDVKNKLLSLLLDVSACTDGALLTVKMFTQVDGVERKVYSQNFLVNTDPDGLWITQSPVGIHEALRVEVYSNTNESVAIGYDYMLEAM